MWLRPSQFVLPVLPWSEPNQSGTAGGGEGCGFTPASSTGYGQHRDVGPGAPRTERIQRALRVETFDVGIVGPVTSAMLCEYGSIRLRNQPMFRYTMFASCSSSRISYSPNTVSRYRHLETTRSCRRHVQPTNCSFNRPRFRKMQGEKEGVVIVGRPGVDLCQLVPYA